MKLSPELQRELTRWLSDATSSEPSELVKTSGLCGYVDMYVREELSSHLGYLVRMGLARSKCFPFDKPGEFCMKSFEQKMHLNPKRLAFVRSILDAKD